MKNPAYTLFLAVVAIFIASLQSALAAEQTSQPQYEMIIERDVDVPMRDGLSLKADLFKPDSDEQFPVILTLGPYCKDRDDASRAYPISQGESGPLMNHETPHPPYWTPRGYAVLRIDSRGTCKSPGRADLFSVSESEDFYDAIEWAAAQPWSNGNIGLLGISYYALNQWTVASLQPPSLKAIIPWEGFSDLYRDAVFHGGIFNFAFLTRWYNSSVVANSVLEDPLGENPGELAGDLILQFMKNQFDGPWWDGRRAQFDKIEVPLFSSANWGPGIHFRGNLEGYLQSASEHKKLQIHTGHHVESFYTDEGRQEQLRFFDYWLKGIDTGIMDEPPIHMAILTELDEIHEWRYEDEWPLARTEWTDYYLTSTPAGAAPESPNDGSLQTSPQDSEEAVSYSALSGSGAYGQPRFGGISFTTEPMSSDTEITGPVNLVLWASSTTQDMDVFATLKKVRTDGTETVISKGWLKASHRELDPELSTPYRPFHTHTNYQPLSDNEVVELQVEIWPIGIHFEEGSRLRLDIAPRSPDHYAGNYQVGENTIYIGGDRASHLKLPFIPGKE